MLEEHNKIDTIAIAKDGFVELVIMDAGITEDPEARFFHLGEKLKSYIYYVIEGGFKVDYPGKTLNDVRFLVMCRIPPTDKMAKLKRLSNPERPEEGFDIHYRHFPGTDDSEEVMPSKAAPSGGKFPLYVGSVLAAVTAVASLIGWFNTGRSPWPGIIVATLFGGFGFLMTAKKRG